MQEVVTIYDVVVGALGLAVQLKCLNLLHKRLYLSLILAFSLVGTLVASFKLCDGFNKHLHLVVDLYQV